MPKKQQIKTTIEIPKPKFEQYETAILEWNGKHHKVRVGLRQFHLDEGMWYYKITGNDKTLWPEFAFYYEYETKD